MLPLYALNLAKQNKSSYFPYTGSSQEHSPTVVHHLPNNKEVVGVEEGVVEVQVVEGVEEEVGVEALVVEGVTVAATVVVVTVIIHTNNLYIL